MWSSFTKDEKKLFIFLLTLLLIGAIVFPIFDAQRRTEIFVAGDSVTTVTASWERGRSANRMTNAGGKTAQELNAPLDLNVVTQRELEALPGIGQTRAAAIIQYREAHGGFHSVDELTKVPGIGKKIAAQVATFVEVKLKDTQISSTLRTSSNVFIPLANMEQSSMPTKEPIHQARFWPTSVSGSNVLNINTASESELAALEQIGPVLAARIVQYRLAHGPFRSVDELAKVNGVGKKRIELNRSRLMAK